MKREPSDRIDERTHVLVSVAKRQWERTFDAISEPLMIIDRAYVVRRANLALADDLGVAVQRLVNRTCYEVRSESPHAFQRKGDGPCADCPVAQARGAGEAQEGQLHADSGRVYRLRAYPLDDEAGPMTVCSYRDVSAEQKMSAKLALADKLAAVGRLAGGVAHEINNPLGGILAFTQILLSQDTTPEERREYLKEIERSALRCKTIVESLIRFARQTPVASRSAVSANRVVEEAVRAVEQKLRSDPARGEVAVRLEGDLPPVRGDVHQLEQVVVNLLMNAHDSVTASRAPGEGRIEVSTRVRDGHVEIEVADNGRGIPAPVFERIYEPFFTTKEEGRGPGLGLAVTYAIVQEHGGRILALNRPSGGAALTVAFPVASR
jgi:two-component system NtrC family sensor kinase